MSGRIGRRVALAGLGLAALAPGTLCAAPRANPWPRWQVSDETARTSVDHAAWEEFLKRYLVPGADGVARVAYRRVLPADREALSVYIAGLCGLPVTAYRRAEQQAYWINLYNALTQRVVLEHYPVASILDINLTGGPLGHGPWSKKLVHIEGEEVSLDDIEHRILRPLWRDPRVHYALNCAALGCPNLQPRAFNPSTADAMLDAAARGYVNHPRGVRLDHGRLYVSSIYVWYEADFGGDDRGVIEHLRRFAAAPLAEALARQASIAGDSYDWSLNDAKGV
jgi:hypothetical protein